MEHIFQEYVLWLLKCQPDLMRRLYKNKNNLAPPLAYTLTERLFKGSVSLKTLLKGCRTFRRSPYPKNSLKGLVTKLFLLRVATSWFSVK